MPLLTVWRRWRSPCKSPKDGRPAESEVFTSIDMIPNKVAVVSQEAAPSFIHWRASRSRYRLVAPLSAFNQARGETGYAKSFILTGSFQLLHTRSSPPLFAFSGFPFDTRYVSDMRTNELMIDFQGQNLCAPAGFCFLPVFKFSEVVCGTHPLD